MFFNFRNSTVDKKNPKNEIEKICDFCGLKKTTHGSHACGFYETVVVNGEKKSICGKCFARLRNNEGVKIEFL